MIRYFLCATAVVSLLTASLSAQTIRFDTNVGTFDLKLNPTGNPHLQGHVDNMLAYVESGRYDHTVINRAPANFVLQMGGFIASTLTLPDDFSFFPRVQSFPQVVVDSNNDGVIDFDRTALKNTPGTVSLALSGPPNTGSNSFFVNIGDNSVGSNSLDVRNFVPFAEITNMATIDLIMALDKAFVPDSTAPQNDLDSNGASTASRDIPVLANDRLIFVHRAFVTDISDAALAASIANATIFNSPPTGEVSSAAGSSPGDLASIIDDDPPLNDPGGILITPTVPEPSTAILAGALALLALTRRR